jgi:hypothetical protein
VGWLAMKPAISSSSQEGTKMKKGFIRGLVVLGGLFVFFIILALVLS